MFCISTITIRTVAPDSILAAIQQVVNLIASPGAEPVLNSYMIPSLPGRIGCGQLDGAKLHATYGVSAELIRVGCWALARSNGLGFQAVLLEC